MIPNTIEVIIKASKGQIKLDKKKKPKNKVKVDTVKISEQLYKRVVKFVKDQKYDASTISKNLFIITTQIMSLIEEYPYMSGSDKKVVVLSVMNKLVDHIKEIYPDATEEQIHMLRTAMKMMPSVIEAVVSAMKHNIDINAIIEQVSGCFRGICKKRK